MRLFPLAAVPLIALVACDPYPTPRSGTQKPSTPTIHDLSACDADQYRGLIGQDATALERVLILQPVRVIRPGQAITMDYMERRINFDVDANNRVVNIHCG